MFYYRCLHNWNVFNWNLVDVSVKTCCWNHPNTFGYVYDLNIIYTWKSRTLTNVWFKAVFAKWVRTHSRQWMKTIMCLWFSGNQNITTMIAVLVLSIYMNLTGRNRRITIWHLFKTCSSVRRCSHSKVLWCVCLLNAVFGSFRGEKVEVAPKMMMSRQ